MVASSGSQAVGRTRNLLRSRARDGPLVGVAQSPNLPGRNRTVHTKLPFEVIMQGFPVPACAPDTFSVLLRWPAPHSAALDVAPPPVSLRGEAEEPLPRGALTMLGWANHGQMLVPRWPQLSEVGRS